MKKFALSPVALFLLFCIPLVLLPTACLAQTKTASLSSTISPGSWKGIRLKNLPTGAKIGVRCTADHPVKILFVNQENYDQFPKIEHPLFTGMVKNKFSFSVLIPKTGHYYLIIDNRDGQQTSECDITITAAADGKLTGVTQKQVEEVSEKVDLALQKFGERLNKVFIFKPFPIETKLCGSEKAYCSKDGVVLCLEYINKIYKTLADREKAQSVLQFVLFHEISHILLYQWGYPFYDNEEVADEFTTALFVLTGQKDRISATAEYFISNPSKDELLAKAFQNDRHPLSIQRARNILTWIKSPDRTQRWVRLFLPHFQNKVIQKLLATSHNEKLRKLLKEELRRRKTLGSIQ